MRYLYTFGAHESLVRPPVSSLPPRWYRLLTRRMWQGLPELWAEAVPTRRQESMSALLHFLIERMGGGHALEAGQLARCGREVVRIEPLAEGEGEERQRLLEKGLTAGDMQAGIIKLVRLGTLEEGRRIDHDDAG